MRSRVQWAALAEAAGVFLLIELYIWRIRPAFPLFWLLILALIVASHPWRGETPREMGFRITGFRRGVPACAPWVAALVVALLALAAVLHTLRDVTFEHAAMSFLLYCAWGLVQQYLLNAYFVNRFVEARMAAPLMGAICFSLAHIPNWFLMVITLAGGYAAARVYLVYRNLFLLGMAHAVIGFALYLTVPDAVTRHFYVGPGWFRR
jgi:hypothetical protein